MPLNVEDIVGMSIIVVTHLMIATPGDEDEVSLVHAIAFFDFGIFDLIFCLIITLNHRHIRSIAGTRS
jgi:hypothetical protein